MLFREQLSWYSRFNTDLISYKIIDEELMYVPKDDTQNNTFCRTYWLKSWTLRLRQQ